MQRPFGLDVLELPVLLVSLTSSCQTPGKTRKAAGSVSAFMSGFRTTTSQYPESAPERLKQHVALTAESTTILSAGMLSEPAFCNQISALE
jgi:hypothetical protein